MARWILSLLLVQAAALAALAKPVTFTFHDGVAASADGPVTFHGQRVLRCESRLSRAEVEALEADPALDIWAVKPDHFDVRLISENHASAAILDDARCSTWIEDVQEAVEAAAEPADPNELVSLLGDEAFTLDPFFSEFQTYEAHVAQLKKYATTFPTLATLIPSIGKSIEGRDLVAIRITGSKAVSTTKKAFWVNGGQHAREWASPAATAYIADTLLNGYGTDAEITKILDNFVVYVLTVQNPDGYAYTHKTNRLWRKNRRLVKGTTYGVDLNRNWDDHWGQGGSSTTPSAEDYRGASAASEPEVSELQKYILTIPNRFAGIDFHAYGELVLRNFGWTTKAGAQEARLVKISNGIVQAIKTQSGRTYTGERASELYVTTGSTDDWLTDAADMEGWTIELGTTFTEPVSKLVPIAQQAWAGLKYYLLEILAR